MTVNKGIENPEMSQRYPTRRSFGTRLRGFEIARTAPQRGLVKLNTDKLTKKEVQFLFNHVGKFEEIFHSNHGRLGYARNLYLLNFASQAALYDLIEGLIDVNRAKQEISNNELVCDRIYIKAKDLVETMDQFALINLLQKRQETIGPADTTAKKAYELGKRNIHQRDTFKDNDIHENLIHLKDVSQSYQLPIIAAEIALDIPYLLKPLDYEKIKREKEQQQLIEKLENNNLNSEKENTLIRKVADPFLYFSFFSPEVNRSVQSKSVDELDFEDRFKKICDILIELIKENGIKGHPVVRDCRKAGIAALESPETKGIEYRKSLYDLRAFVYDLLKVNSTIPITPPDNHLGKISLLDINKGTPPSQNYKLFNNSYTEIITRFQIDLRKLQNQRLREQRLQEQQNKIYINRAFSELPMIHKAIINDSALDETDYPKNPYKNIIEKSKKPTWYSEDSFKIDAQDSREKQLKELDKHGYEEEIMKDFLKTVVNSLERFVGCIILSSENYISLYESSQLECETPDNIEKQYRYLTEERKMHQFIFWDHAVKQFLQKKPRITCPFCDVFDQHSAGPTPCGRLYSDTGCGFINITGVLNERIN